MVKSTTLSTTWVLYCPLSSPEAHFSYKTVYRGVYILWKVYIFFIAYVVHVNCAFIKSQRKTVPHTHTHTHFLTCIALTTMSSRYEKKVQNCSFRLKRIKKTKILWFKRKTNFTQFSDNQFLTSYRRTSFWKIELISIYGS